MKVVCFTPLPPYVIGGIEDYSFNVNRYLKEKVVLSIITSKINGNLELRGDSCSEGWNITEIPSFYVLRRPIPQPWHLFKIISEIKKADVVQIHMPFPVMELFASIAARAFRKPVIVTYHMDAVPDIGINNPLGRAFSRMLSYLYMITSVYPSLLLSKKIVTNSRAYISYSKVLPKFKDKVVAIHQGVDENKLKCDDAEVASYREKLLEDGFSKIVGFVGRLVPYKGLEYLIEAARIIRDEYGYRDIIFAIGGKGPEKDKLQKMGDNYSLNNVKFLGFIPDEEFPLFLKACDVIVSPSVSPLESTPITLLEALYCGTPVIGTKVGGTEECVPNDGKRGLIIRERDSKALAEAIVKMLDNKKSSNFKTLYNRTWKNVADEYLGLFEDVTKS